MKLTTAQETKLNKIFNACNALDVYSYRGKHYKAKYNAQNNLEGRTHYVDDGTLSYFKCKIIKASELADGLFFIIQESLPCHNKSYSRIHRVRVFSLFGEIVDYGGEDSSDRDHKFKLSSKASDTYYELYDKYNHASFALSLASECLKNDMKSKSNQLRNARAFLKAT